MNKYLIVGLGNIGDEYAHTRHNIGFDIIDELAKQNAVRFQLSRYAFHAQYQYKRRTVNLIKPTTYMNLSGKAVKYWMQAANVNIENTLILVDELAIDFNTIRLRAKGSHGGHNGLQSIADALASTHYPRLRFGIGSGFPRGKQVDYVLSKWTKKEEEILWQGIDLAIQAIVSFLVVGLDKTMTQFNK